MCIRDSYYTAWNTDRDTVVYTGMKYVTQWFAPNEGEQDEMFFKLGYIDVINFVDRITCPVLFGTGLMDELIAPETQYEVYRRITAPKVHYIYPDYGHEEIADFDDKIIDFFMKEDE